MKFVNKIWAFLGLLMYSAFSFATDPAPIIDSVAVDNAFLQLGAQISSFQSKVIPFVVLVTMFFVALSLFKRFIKSAGR